MQKLHSHHYSFAICTVGQSLFVTLIVHNMDRMFFPFLAWLPLALLYARCNDKQFGNGRPFHAWRQWFLGVGAALTLLAGIFPIYHK